MWVMSKQPLHDPTGHLWFQLELMKQQIHPHTQPEHSQAFNWSFITSHTPGNPFKDFQTKCVAVKKKLKELSLQRTVWIWKLAAECVLTTQRDSQPTFVAIEGHSAGMVESRPALALVFVQHEAMADDGSALQDTERGERWGELSRKHITGGGGWKQNNDSAKPTADSDFRNFNV